MSTELFVTPHYPLSELPVIVPPPSPLPLTFSTKDFLLTFPPNAATVLRSHRHHISSHQRHFHTRRLLRSAAAFHTTPSDGAESGGGALTEGEVRRRVDDVCDTLLATIKTAPHHELIISIICVTLLNTTTTTTATCFVAHARFTSPFPGYVPLVTCLLHPTPLRYLPTFKHSQWIRDRAPLEQLKTQHECGELIMCEESSGAAGSGGGSHAREGLITNVLVEEGGRVKGCTRNDRLVGYFESLLDSTDSGSGTSSEEAAVAGGGVTVDGLRCGRYDSVFITGTSICIAGVSGVKWLADARSGQSAGQQQYSEASIRRVEAVRLRMLATLDRHIAEDKINKISNGT